MSVTFTINNGFTVVSMVQLSKIATMVPDMYSVTGTFCNVKKLDSTNRPSYGSMDNFSSITIDGDKAVQGTNKKVSKVLAKVLAAAGNRTGKAMITGKKLVIQTS